MNIIIFLFTRGESMNKIIRKAFSLCVAICMLLAIGTQSVFGVTGVAVTGDNTNIKTVIGIIAVAVVGLIITLVKKKK